MKNPGKRAIHLRQRKNMYKKNTKQTVHVNFYLGFLILIFVSIGCLGPSADSDKCSGIVKSGGKEYVGKAKYEKQAKLNACNKFCLETDSEFDGMYQIWLSSPAGKDFAERRKSKPTKEDAIFEDKRLLNYITKNCANRCYQEANKGKHTLNVKCRK